MRGKVYDLLEQRVEDLATLPGVAVQLIEKCSQTDVRISELASLIEADQAIAAKILRLANSAFYGRPSAVSTIREAVMMLGLETVRALGLSTGVYAVFERQPTQDRGGLERLWQHGIAVALCAREISRRVGHKERERAFVAGLLHDIGQVVLAQHLPESYPAVIATARTAHLPLERAERDMLGTDHAEVGGWLLERWHLPPELRLPVSLHHQATLPASGDATAVTACIIQVADWLATSQGLGSPWRDDSVMLVPQCRANLAIEDDALIQLCLGLDKRVSQVAVAMGLSAISPDVFQRALYSANRSLAQMAVELDQRSRRLQRSLALLELLQSVSAALAASDDLRSMLEAYVRAMCAATWLDHVQAVVPLSRETVLLATGERTVDGVASAQVRSVSAGEWLRSQQLWSRSPAYLRGSFRLLNGSQGELAVRLRQDPDVPAKEIDLGPFVSLLGLAVERAVANREAADIAERLKVQAAQSAPAAPSPAAANSVESDQRLRLLGEMTAGAAHDLNNAIAIMLGQAQLGMLVEDVAEARHYLGAIEKSAKDCAATVRRLQEFARGTRKSQAGRTCDLAAVARESVEITRPRWRDEAQKRGIQITPVVDVPESLLVDGDAAAFREVLTNLIFNAIDAMPNGGTLAVRAWSEMGRAHLSVRDSGVGITPEVREHIFEPFYTTKGEKGTGLGLAMCKRIIEEHLGEISVFSRPGAGTTFLISLPLAGAASDAKAEGPVLQMGRTLKVLVIDDEPQVREVLQRMLRLDGHLAQAASLAREGLEAFGQERYDLVITDLGLPDMPGWDVARAIKAGSPATPVVLMTGWSEEQDRPLSGGGVAAVLVKPFGIAELRQVIRSVVPEGEARATADGSPGQNRSGG